MTLGERPALPARLHIALAQHAPLRYGENPHQKAALYIPGGHAASGLAGARQLQGKELSYNNLVDLDAAWALAQEFARPASVIVKHNNPCGTAEQDDAGRGVPPGAGLRSGFGVWRRAGVQSPARRRDGGGSGQALCRVHRGAGIRRRGARGAGGEEESAIDGDRRGAAAGGQPPGN